MSSGCYNIILCMFCLDSSTLAECTIPGFALKLGLTTVSWPLAMALMVTRTTGLSRTGKTGMYECYSGTSEQARDMLGTI